MNPGTAIRPIGHDGLTSAERTILKLWDRGEAMDQIVATTGYTLTAVYRCINTFDGDEAERRFVARAIRGSKMMLAAITASGGQFA